MNIHNVVNLHSKILNVNDVNKSFLGSTTLGSTNVNSNVIQFLNLYDTSSFSQINKRLEVIQLLYNEKELVSSIEKLFESVIKESSIDIGLNKLEKIVKEMQLNNASMLLDTVVKYINIKIDMYIEVIKQHSNLTFDMYVQIWKDYNSFNKNIEKICKSQNKNNFDMLNHIRLLKVDLFYNRFCCYSKNILDNILNYDVKLSYSNIESYLSYVESNYHLNLYLKKINKTSPLKSLEEIFNNEYNLNLCIVYIDKLFYDLNSTIFYHRGKKLYNKSIMTRIKILLNILQESANSRIFTPIYMHYFKSRITSKKYNNIEAEQECINTLGRILGHEIKKKCENLIHEVNFSESFTRELKSINIVVKKEKYKQFEYNNQVLQPLLITQQLWDLPLVFFTDIKFVDEIMFYMKIAKRIYKNTVDQLNNQTTIIWNGELGYATVEAKLNDTTITIICNILQLNLLLHINTLVEFKIGDIERDLKINYNLAFKLIESLLVSNLLTYSLDYSSFVVNENYNGDEFIDILKIFVDGFKINTQEKN